MALTQCRNDWSGPRRKEEALSEVQTGAGGGLDWGLTVGDKHMDLTAFTWGQRA